MLEKNMYVNLVKDFINSNNMYYVWVDYKCKNTKGANLTITIVYHNASIWTSVVSVC